MFSLVFMLVLISNRTSMDLNMFIDDGKSVRAYSKDCVIGVDMTTISAFERTQHSFDYEEADNPPEFPTFSGYRFSDGDGNASMSVNVSETSAHLPVGNDRLPRPSQELEYDRRSRESNTAVISNPMARQV
jgi:hypothetical protein